MHTCKFISLICAFIKVHPLTSASSKETALIFDILPGLKARRFLLALILAGIIAAPS
jgi:hypothetical protein